MTLTFLSLPKELRLMVYTYALRSPTGLVIYKANLHNSNNNNNIGIQRGAGRTVLTLYAASPPHSQHYDPLAHEPMNIALLQVSSQIHAETRDLLWAHNVLVFGPHDLPHLQQQHRIQHVLLQYRLDEDDRRGPHPLHRTIGILGQWADQGNLKSITMRTREPLRHPYDSQQFVERIIEGHLIRWRDATADGGCLSKVFRMVIFTGVNLYALRSSCRPIIQLEEIQNACHRAMGAEIWTEGVLCWKDGVQISSPWSAFEWVGSPGLLRPRILPSVQREIDALPDERAVFGNYDGT